MTGIKNDINPYKDNMRDDNRSEISIQIRKLEYEGWVRNQAVG